MSGDRHSVISSENCCMAGSGLLSGEVRLLLTIAYFRCWLVNRGLDNADLKWASNSQADSRLKLKALLTKSR